MERISNMTCMPRTLFKRTAVDLAMLLLLFPLMAHSRIGETFHEAAGMCLLVLVMVHLWQNRAWLKNIFKGRCSAERLLHTACFAALLAAAAAQIASGILMSGLFDFLSMRGAAADARAVHLCAAYWCFALMAVHAGLHAGRLTGWLHKKMPCTALRMTALACAGAYGAFAFVSRGFHEYMLQQKAFAFLDFDEPLLFLLADHAAVFCLFALAGHAATKALANTRHTAPGQEQPFSNRNDHGRL